MALLQIQGLIWRKVFQEVVLAHGLTKELVYKDKSLKRMRLAY